MPEFHDYSKFVTAAYFAAGFILLGSALFFSIQLKKNETAFKKNQSQKAPKN